MKIKRVLLHFVLVSILFFAVSTPLAFSQSPNNDQFVDCGVIPDSICQQIVGTRQAAVTNPESAIRPLVEWVANILIAVFGSVAVLVIIISGVQISASAGNEEVVKKGKENIFKVVTGLILLISFRAILSLIDRAFVGVSTTNIFTSSGGLAPSGIPLLINNVIGIASLAAGTVSVIMIIVGGIQYIASGGGDGMVRAKKTITYAVSGLVISILAYTIVTFINSQLQ